MHPHRIRRNGLGDALFENLVPYGGIPLVRGIGVLTYRKPKQERQTFFKKGVNYVQVEKCNT